MSKQNPGLFDSAPISQVKFYRPTGDTAAPIGKWLIRVSDCYLKTLKIDAMDKYILNEYLASADGAAGWRWYFYHTETLRILGCPSFEQHMDEVEGVIAV